MPQVFRPASVLFLKVASIAGVVVSTAAVLAWRTAIAPAAALDAPVEQPIPFSHQHHVGDDGIDCRFCHAAVETSASAGLPTSDVCLTCHAELYRDATVLAPLHASVRTGRPVAWKRVHDLPDFVFFNHGIHVAKGVGCASCHGALDRMPLTRRTQSLEMQWCLDCHRAPERALRPKDRIVDLHWSLPTAEQLALGRRLVRENGIDLGHITQCSTCHR